MHMWDYLGLKPRSPVAAALCALFGVHAEGVVGRSLEKNRSAGNVSLVCWGTNGKLGDFGDYAKPTSTWQPGRTGSSAACCGMAFDVPFLHIGKLLRDDACNVLNST